MNELILIISSIFTILCYVLSLYIKHDLITKRKFKVLLNIITFLTLAGLVVSLIFIYINYIKPPDIIFVDTTNHNGKTIKQKDTTRSFETVKPLEENEVEHNGTLRIRILKDSEPVSFIATAVSCSKGEVLERFKAVTEKEIQIGDCESTYINCQLNQRRWLLDRFATPKIMPNYNIEINGKIIPTKYVEDTNNGKSADYIILLRRIN